MKLTTLLCYAVGLDRVLRRTKVTFVPLNTHIQVHETRKSHSLVPKNKKKKKIILSYIKETGEIEKGMKGRQTPEGITWRCEAGV